MKKNNCAREKMSAASKDLTSTVEIINNYDEGEVQHKITEFVVETDSVVATATLVLDQKARKIIIDWGDGSDSDIVTVQPGIPPNPIMGSDVAPAGTYSFAHAYAPSEDRLPFDHIVTALVQDTSGDLDIRTRAITLRPRYRITYYNTSVRLLGPCDPNWVDKVTISVKRYIDNDINLQWKWVTYNFLSTESVVLPESAMVRELEKLDILPIKIVFVEKDSLSYDDVSIYYASMIGTMESENVVVQTSEGCPIEIHYFREVKLIGSLPITGPVFVAAGGT